MSRTIHDLCRVAAALMLAAALVSAARAQENSEKKTPGASPHEANATAAPMTPEQLKAAAAESGDPVAIALTVVHQRRPGPFGVATPAALAAMDILTDHWRDARVREVLSEIAKGEPKREGDLNLTAAGEAAARLELVDARGQRAAILGQAKTPDERMARIRECFKEHPQWLTSGHDILVDLLLDDAVEAAGADAVDLVVESRRRLIVRVFVKQYPQASLDYARKIGRDGTLSKYEFVVSLAATGMPEVAAMFEEWLPQETDAKRLRTVVGMLSSYPNGQQRLIRLLRDPRIEVFATVARYLRNDHLSPESLAAVRSEIARRRQAGDAAANIRILEGIAEDMHTQLSKPDKGE